jgi:hypothetical protein
MKLSVAVQILLAESNLSTDSSLSFMICSNGGEILELRWDSMAERYVKKIDCRILIVSDFFGWSVHTCFASPAGGSLRTATLRLRRLPTNWARRPLFTRSRLRRRWESWWIHGLLKAEKTCGVTQFASLWCSLREVLPVPFTAQPGRGQSAHHSHARKVCYW